MRRNDAVVARARELLRDAEVGNHSDRTRVIAELVAALTYSDSLIEQALIELRAPLDTNAVLDTHAGRALWKANQAGTATRILCRAELLGPQPHNLGSEHG